MNIVVFIIHVFFNEKVTNTILSFAISTTLRKIFEKLKKNEIDKAYKRAVNKFTQNRDTQDYYHKIKLDTLQDFANYIITGKENTNGIPTELFELFEEELRKDPETYRLLLDLQNQAEIFGINKLISSTQNIIVSIEEQKELLNEIRQKFSEFNIGIRHFEMPKNYMQRTCSLKISPNDYVSYFQNPNKYQPHKLFDFVLGNTECQENKFILYSDAQSGKTTELLKLGCDLCEEGTFIPIMYKVNGYPELRSNLPSLSEEQDKSVVLIIDALDERFDGDKRFDLYNEIKTYSEEHPNLHIVLSCRSNFLSEQTFDNFIALSLNDLSNEDAFNYIKSQGTTQLISEVKKHSLYEFIRIPFYLMALVNYYLEKKVLPNNKSDLYNFFIDERLKNESNKRIKKSFNFQIEGKNALKKIAVAIQLMSLNELSEDDISELSDGNKDYLELVLHSGILVEMDNKKYGFIHNAFKEHLVSQYLLKLNNIDSLKELSCYKNTNTIRSTWYNTIALLLSQLPKNEELAQDILDWIVSDNKLMVLYIDSRMFDEVQRSNLFKEILEWHKTKNLRLSDFADSKYEKFMNFGFSNDSILYLATELENCSEINNHIINILSLIRYLKFNYLEDALNDILKQKLFKIYATYIQVQDFAYYLFKIFENPYLLNIEITKVIYDAIKDSQQPDVVNYFVDYVIKSGGVEEYIDVILQKTEFIHNYKDNNGYYRIVHRDILLKAYSSVTTWESIKKVLTQLAKEFVNHMYNNEYERKDFDSTLSKLLNRAFPFCKNNLENSDFIFSCLLKMGEESYSLKSERAQPYLDFFNSIDMEEYYFVHSLEDLKKRLFDSDNKDHIKLEAAAFCTSLFLSEERLDEITAAMGQNTYEGYILLSWLKSSCSLENFEQINIILRNRYPSYWKDFNKPSEYDIRQQRDYDELMIYQVFKSKVLQIVDEKTPHNKEELKYLRRKKTDFNDDEYERINNYVFQFIYELEPEDETYDLEAIKNSINDIKIYHKFIVLIMVSFIYNKEQRLIISQEQKDIFIDATIEWLNDLVVREYCIRFRFSCPPISALLHKEVVIDKELLIKLLPYSSCRIDIINNNISEDYTLFDYIIECGGFTQMELTRNIQQYLSDTEVCHEQNQKIWGKFLLENQVVSEYSRIMNWILEMPDHDPSFYLIRSLVNNYDTKEMLLRDDFLKNCSDEKKIFIYEEIINKDKNNDFVISRLEAEFEQYENMNKKRALGILLSGGSIEGLKYMSNHLDMVEFNTAMHYKNIKALPFILEAYSKTLDINTRSQYSFIINSLEEMALFSMENWNIVKRELEGLIESNRKKYVNLNFYLDRWGKQIMEKNTPTLDIHEVKQILCNVGN